MGTGGDLAIYTDISSLEEDISSLLGFTAAGLQSHFDTDQVTEEDVCIVN